MLARLLGVTRLLISPGDAELGGGVQRVQLECVLECIDGLGILLRLRVHRAQEVPGIGVVRIDFGNVPEGRGGRVGFVGVLVVQAEVVPGMRVLGSLLDHLFEQRLRLVHLLQIEKRDAAV